VRDFSLDLNQPLSREDEKAQVIVSSQLTVGFDELSDGEWESLLRKLTFPLNGDAVVCYRRLLTKRCYKLPRGAWNLLPNSITYHDRRVCPPAKVYDFTVKLDDTSKDERFSGQSEAVEAMFENEQGLLIRPPGTGKTQIALAFAAKCKTKTLVLVHTEDILQQWVKATENAIPDAPVGVIRQGEYRLGHVTIATVQTLNKRYLKKPREWWQQWGCVIADEAHHVSAPSWEAVLNRCYARYRFGFTASETRADGMHPTMKFIIGPVIHKMKFKTTVKLTVEPVQTGFRYFYRGRWDWMPLLQALTDDEERNRKVAEIVDREIADGNSVLVLSRRIGHLGNIAGFVESDCEVLTGNRSRADRKRILADFRSGRLKALLATQLADEALDVPRLNRVVLTFPGKHEGRIIQQIGRALRTHESKTDAVIYDMVDEVGVLRHQYNQRVKTYNQNRIHVNTPIARRIKRLWR
jgi:superfamily II DNA or RNA helicase